MSSGQHSHSRRSSSTIPNRRAALYLRSSKDRADVSIDAQRRELRALALSKNLPIVVEFADVVLSGADETRPGFQSLLREIQSKQCRFSVLLALDTSRIARDEYVSAQGRPRYVRNKAMCGTKDHRRHALRRRLKKITKLDINTSMIY